MTLRAVLPKVNPVDVVGSGYVLERRLSVEERRLVMDAEDA